MQHLQTIQLQTHGAHRRQEGKVKLQRKNKYSHIRLLSFFQLHTFSQTPQGDRKVQILDELFITNATKATCWLVEQERLS